jgi:hypothetical protein
MALAGLGCREPASTSPGEAAREGEPPPAVPTDGFVVLPWGTRVYLEPRFGGYSARLGWPNVAPPPWPTTGYVARVVGERDGFVEIAPIMPPFPSEVHCGPLLDGEAFDVRLYVSPWALAPVLVRDHAVTLDDGTSLMLRPGAVAQPIPDDPQRRWAISAGGIRVRTALPDDAMGLAYATLEPIPMPSHRPWQMPEGRPFSFDGWPLELDFGFGHDVAIASVEPKGERYVVELTTPCGRVLAHADKAPLSWSSEPFTEFGLGTEAGVPADVLEQVGLAPPRKEVIEEKIVTPIIEEPIEGVEGGVPVGVEGGVSGGVEGGVPVGVEGGVPGGVEGGVEGGVPGGVVGGVLGGVVDVPSSDTAPPAAFLFEEPLPPPEPLGAFGGLIGGVPGVPVRLEHRFEEGTPLYLSPAGPAAGTLFNMRVFAEDGWIAGDRLCFHTSFGSRFDPSLPVCLPADESMLRNPTTDVFDFSTTVVRPGTLKVTGALAEAKVSAALRRHRHELRRCMGEAMQLGVPAIGELELALDVSRDGTVTDARLRSPPVQTLGDCALAAAKRWRLPKPTNGKAAQVVFSVKLEQQP